MIKISINGVFLDLGETNIRLEKTNPMFTTDIYQGDWSFPFTIPLTEHNIRIIGHQNRHDIIDRKIDFVVDVYLFGVFYSTGRLYITSATNTNIGANLAFGLMALKYVNESLKTIDYGTDYILGSDTASICQLAKITSLVSDWTIYGFSFVPHFNSEFYGTTNTAFQGMINCVNSTNGNLKYNNSVTGNKYNLVPWLFLFFVLDKIFKAEGLTPKGTFWDDTEAKTILLYNNFALDSPSVASSTYLQCDSIVNYNQTARVQFKKGPVGTFDNLGGWSNANSEITLNNNYNGNCIIDVDLNVYIGSNFAYDGVYWLPQFDLMVNGVVYSSFYATTPTPGTFQRVQASIPITFTSGNFGQKVYIRYAHPTHSSIASPYAHNVLSVQVDSTILVTNITAQNLNLYDYKLKYANHVKDITVGKLLSELKKAGIDIQFNFQDKTVTLNKISEYIKYPELVDYNKKQCSEIELSFETKNKGFKFIYDFGSSDTYTEDNFKPIEGLSVKYIVKTKFQLPSPSKIGDLAYIEQLCQYYIVKETSGNFSWEYYSDNYFDKILGEGETEIRAELAPMLMGFHNNEDGTSDQNLALVPHIKEKGSGKMFGLGINDCSLRYTFHRGTNNYNGLTASTTPTAKGGTYGFASSGRYGANGFEHGKYSSPPSVSDSFFSQVLLPWLNVLNSGEVMQTDIMLNKHDILTSNTSKMILLQNTPFFIKNISMPINNEVLRKSRFKLLRMV